MTRRDYLKNNYQKPKKNTPRNKSGLLLILAIILFIAAVADFGYTHFDAVNTAAQKIKSLTVKKPVASKDASKKDSIHKIKTASLKAEPTQPHFDFYQILPKMTVPVPPPAQKKLVSNT